MRERAALVRRLAVAGVLEGRVGRGRRHRAIPGILQLEDASVLAVDEQGGVLGHHRVGRPFTAGDRIRSFRLALVGDLEAVGGHGHARALLVRLDHVRVDARVVEVLGILAQDELPIGLRQRVLLGAVGIRRIRLQELVGHAADVRVVDEAGRASSGREVAKLIGRGVPGPAGGRRRELCGVERVDARESAACGALVALRPLRVLGVAVRRRLPGGPGVPLRPKREPAFRDQHMRPRTMPSGLRLWPRRGLFPERGALLGRHRILLSLSGRGHMHRPGDGLRRVRRELLPLRAAGRPLRLREHRQLRRLKARGKAMRR